MNLPELLLVGVILVLALGAYWAMVIFPKQRAFQHKQKYVRTLEYGDEIVTYGGIIGKIVDLNADTGIAVVEIADGLQIRLLTAALQQRFDPEAIAENAQRGILVDGAQIDEQQLKEQNV